MSETVESVAVVLPTVEAYRSADVAGKARIRAEVDSIMKQAIHDGDLALAQSAMSLSANLTAKSPTVAAPIDWSQVAADRIATLRLAADLIESGVVDPIGFPEGWVSSNESGDGIDLPEGVADRDLADKLASAKLTKSSDRSDIGAAIGSAFADVESGTFLTVAQIANKAGLPSQGAVAARLFPKSGTCTVTGVVPTEATATSPKGATKA